MWSLLRLMAIAVIAPFATACGDALPTTPDAPDPVVAADDEVMPPECDPDHPDFNEDECEGWMGSGG